MGKEPGHFRVSTVDLIMTKGNRHEFAVEKQIDEEISDVLNQAGFFDTAPFQRLDVTLRLGTKEQEQPQNLGIDKKLGWLELAIETEAEILNWKIQPADYIKRKYLPPVCRAIRYAGEMYGLPIDGLDEYEARILAGDSDILLGKKTGRKPGTLAVSTVGLALTKRNRQDQTVLRQFREEIGDVLNRAGFFDTAPFQRVDVVLRLGTKEQEQPQNLGIDKELGWLELAIETEVEIRNWKIQPADNVKRRYLPPVCRAIRYAGEKYGLPIDGLDEYEARILAGDPDQC